jgi:hypothetical protein
MRSRAVVTGFALLGSLSFVISQDSVSYDFDSYGQGDSLGTPVQSYMSNTNVKPPQVYISTNGTGLADGYVFLGMDGQTTSGQNWPAIYGTFSLRHFIGSQLV